MAELQDTVLLDAIVKVGSGKFNEFESRLSNYGALQAFKDNAPGLLPESAVVSIKKSTRQPEKVPVLNKFASTLITAPSCTITGQRPVSAFKALTWAYVGFQTKIIPSINEDNYISVVDDLAMQMRMGWKTVFANLDTKAVTTLETNKSTSLVASKNTDVHTNAGSYGWVGDYKRTWLVLPGLLAINDIEPMQMQDVANSEAQTSILDAQTFGLQNQQNLAGVVNGTLKGAVPVEHYLTNRIVPSGSNQETHYLFPDGSVGVYNWVDPDSRAGRTIGATSWGTVTDPMMGFDWGVYSVEACTDASAQVSGLTRAYSKIAEIGAYFAFVTEYSSDTTSPIIKVNLSTGGGS